MKIDMITTVKKWWVLLIAALINSVVFACFFTVFCLYNMGIATALLIMPLALLIWSLSSVAPMRFFFSTIIFIVAFISIGMPLSHIFYMYIFEMQFPGSRPWAGSGIGMMLATGIYIIMSFIAWVVALVLTIIAHNRRREYSK